MNNMRFFSVTLLPLLLVACSFGAPTNKMEEPEIEGMTIENDDPSNADTDMVEGAENGRRIEDAGGDGIGPIPTRTVKLTTDNWKFTPNMITASVGEDVTVQITGVAGTHGFSIPDLGVNVSIAPGQTVSVDLPTDKAGTFTFRCSVPCGSGHKDMHGQLVIK
ncbi:cupredoxin domain-containing protein [Candidatus Peregrinibacteria bacterium]|nr:cupredoxin domain-containing protein [Candidatus Peregrinibacteria bacterium]